MVGIAERDSHQKNTRLAPCAGQMQSIRRVFERGRTVYVGFSRYMVGYKPSETHLKPSLKRISQVGYED